MKRVCNELEILVKKASILENDIAFAKRMYYTLLKNSVESFKKYKGEFWKQSICENRDSKHEVVKEILDNEKELQKIYKLIKMRF